jgi:hypothetical protein
MNLKQLNVVIHRTLRHQWLAAVTTKTLLSTISSGCSSFLRIVGSKVSLVKSDRAMADPPAPSTQLGFDIESCGFPLKNNSTFPAFNSKVT